MMELAGSQDELLRFGECVVCEILPRAGWSCTNALYIVEKLKGIVTSPHLVLHPRMCAANRPLGVPTVAAAVTRFGE